MKQHASTIIGGVLGVVLLVVVAGFAIFLPKADSQSSSADTPKTLPTLPQKLTGLVALDSDDLPAALKKQIGDISQVGTVQSQAGKGLGKVYGVPAAYKFYASPDAQSLAAVTVLDREPGLFSPDGPPVAASSQQATYQLTRVSGAVCAEYFGQQTSSTGQASGPSQLTRAHCQLGAGGRTYDIDARGLTVAKTVAALKQLAAA